MVSCIYIYIYICDIYIFERVYVWIYPYYIYMSRCLIDIYIYIYITIVPSDVPTIVPTNVPTDVWTFGPRQMLLHGCPRLDQTPLCCSSWDKCPERMLTDSGFPTNALDAMILPTT